MKFNAKVYNETRKDWVYFSDETRRANLYVTLFTAYLPSKVPFTK